MKTLEKPTCGSERVDAVVLKFQPGTTDMNCGSDTVWRLMNTDSETRAFLTSHADFKPAAQATISALQKEFTSATVTVTVESDPDTGAESFRVDIQVADAGAEARQKLRDFVRERLPASAQQFRDLLTFTLCRA